MNVKPLFKLMVEKKASDLFFAPFSPAKIKIEGKIMPVNKLEMTPKMVKQAAFELMTEEQMDIFNRELEIDFALSEKGLGRFRVNVFHQRGSVSMVLRYITSDLPTLDELGMPDQLKELVMLRRGLILMVGATGAGKSTTLAAMINYRNEKTSSHIITIEDPIEFLHPNKQSIINQREVGLDTRSYQRALKSAVRAAPDVIQIGEIRDTESMRAALDMGRKKKEAGGNLGLLDGLKYKVLDSLVTSKIRGRFGGNLRHGFVAGAACPKEIIDFSKQDKLLGLSFIVELISNFLILSQMRSGQHWHPNL